LRAIQRELGDPKIAEQRGRVVKTTGDELPVEFASVVDAVRYPVELQRATAERNADIPAGRRIEFRIGTHHGGVIVEDRDIFGDGLNLAARLEGLADPRGICLSGRCVPMPPPEIVDLVVIGMRLPGGEALRRECALPFFAAVPIDRPEFTAEQFLQLVVSLPQRRAVGRPGTIKPEWLLLPAAGSARIGSRAIPERRI
jgi:hypothetical protein